MCNQLRCTISNEFVFRSCDVQRDSKNVRG
jgi:hypothetical protein